MSEFLFLVFLADILEKKRPLLGSVSLSTKRNEHKITVLAGYNRAV